MKLLVFCILLSVLFTMKSWSQVDSSLTQFIDIRDGKIYKTVKIGSQVWMAENLTFKVDEGCWAYKNDEENAVKYGRLYNYETAKNICPSGWHLPSDEEWKELELSVGLSSQLVEIVMWRGYHGNILKKGGSSGFDIILCGAFNGGDDNKFRAMKKFASFWCITEYDNLNAWVREFDRSIYVGRYPVKKNGGNSVRCIKNN